ncbi:MAG: hypothetical protein LBQ01_01760, partial [Prevotellaceae bacterium]|nr:hypothetical protein [Prevotellaceae bacterium]
GVIGYAELKFHIEVLRTFDRRHHAFSCGTKRLFAMTTRPGLLRLPAGRLVAYPTHKTTPREE